MENLRKRSLRSTRASSSLTRASPDDDESDADEEVSFTTDILRVQISQNDRNVAETYVRGHQAHHSTEGAKKSVRLVSPEPLEEIKELKELSVRTFLNEKLPEPNVLARLEETLNSFISDLKEDGGADENVSPLLVRHIPEEQKRSPKNRTPLRVVQLSPDQEFVMEFAGAVKKETTKMSPRHMASQETSAVIANVEKYVDEPFEEKSEDRGHIPTLINMELEDLVKNGVDDESMEGSSVSTSAADGVEEVLPDDSSDDSNLQSSLIGEDAIDVKPLFATGAVKGKIEFSIEDEFESETADGNERGSTTSPQAPLLEPVGDFVDVGSADLKQSKVSNCESSPLEVIKPVTDMIQAGENDIRENKAKTPNNKTPEIRVTKSGRKVLTPHALMMEDSKDYNRLPKKDVRPSTPHADEQLERKEQYESSTPVIFMAGTTMWARVGAAPYWPCVITNDPNQPDVFSRVGIRGIHPYREYHVQFFGKVVQRAWVSTINLLEYNGIEEFSEKANKLKQELQGKKPAIKMKMLKAYVATGKTKSTWDEAVKDSQNLISLTAQERLEFMRKMADVVPKKKLEDALSETRKRMRDNPEDTANVNHEESAPKRSKYETAEHLIQAIPPETLDNNRRKLKTGFKLYQLANYEPLKAQLGEAGEKIVDKMLSKAWNSLPSLERRYYQDQAAKLFEDEESESSLAMDDAEYILLDSEDEAFNDSASIASSAKSLKSGKHDKENREPSEMLGMFKKESCCLICEEVSITTGDLVKCKGICQNAFHINCLEADVQIGSLEIWKCKECSTGQHSCMICKACDANVQRCGVNNCGRFFHSSCLQTSGLWPQAQISEKQFTCPAHVCHSCASDNPKDPFMKYTSKLLRCIRCPTAYHAGDFCVTAGTVQITSTQIICPKHYVPHPNRKTNSLTHLNVTWCFLCSRGGSLICCEKCPSSFHAECLEIEPPEEVFYCGHCESGRMPLYNEVVWVKLGHYRWWPAKVLHPTQVPGNIERLPHEMGEFPIQFCGSKEYFWMNQGRCFLYESGDAEKIPGASTNKAINNSYNKGLKEAAELFEAYTNAKKEREASNALKVRGHKGMKPPLYTKIKTNRPVGDCPVYTEDALDMQVCECKFDSKSPCGPDSECINRMLMTECQSSSCKAKEKCGNQRFQKRSYPPMHVVRTPDRGWGLFPKAEVKKGDFIIEYVGELITVEEYQRRISASMARNEETNFYYMTVDNNRMIDAGPKGNIARFMNHSCDPNCETQKWTVNGDTKVGLFATKDISAETELTFNYQFESVGEVKKACQCGAGNCSGWIGEKPKDQNGKSGNGTQNEKGAGKKKKKGTKQKKIWEDLCFRCFDDGELLMCDHKTCPKVYHLECLSREKMPREKWFCPWHHCVHCGKPAVGHCMHCPNAYCKNHDSVITEHPELGRICDEHEDDMEDTLDFYRAVGGIGKLVPSPYVPLEEVVVRKTAPTSVDESRRRESAPVTSRTEHVKPFSSRLSLGAHLTVAKKTLMPNVLQNSSGNAKKYHCKCIEIDCQWRGRKSGFFDHLVKRHKLSIPVCHERVRFVLNSMMTDYVEDSRESSPERNTNSESAQNLNESGVGSAKYKRGKEKLKICPEVDCQLKMRASNLVRHIKTKHPNMDQETVKQALSENVFDPDLDQSFEESFHDEELDPTGQTASSSDPVDPKPLEERMFKCQYCGLVMRASNLGRHVKARHENEDAEVKYMPVGEYKQDPNSDGKRKRVECPECRLLLRPSNFYRHWGHRHQDLPVPDMNFKKKSSSVMHGETLGNSNGGISVEPVLYEDESLQHYPFSDEDQSEDAVGNSAPFDSACGYSGCKYVSLSRADLANHRRRNGHPKQTRRSMENEFDEDEDDAEMISVEPEVQLTPAQKKHTPAAFRELKFVCDTEGCGYKSRFRQNLDRHCKKRSHYSEYLLRTSKKANAMLMMLAPQVELTEDGDEINYDDEFEQSKEPEQEGEDEEEMEEEQQSPVEKMDSDEEETVEGVKNYSSESEVDESSGNPTTFCNFDINGLLAGSGDDDE